MKEIGVGVLGWGTVGAGVVEGLLRRGDLLSARAGVRPVLRGVADVDLERDRGYAVDRSLLTTDAAALVDDPRIEVVVELIGGVGISRELVLRALERGKTLVTANKALLATHGPELFSTARARGVTIHFEASVGGGIPVIRALQYGLIANEIRSIYGILNGTSNYILTRMEIENIPFDRALRKAQHAGYAEADPTLDIDGHDTAHKLAILATLAYGRAVPTDAIAVCGIRSVLPADIAYARELGYRIKLLASARPHPDGLIVGVQPTFVPADHLLASVSGVFNAILLDGDLTGQTMYYGRGAGREPTASAVLSDIVEAAHRRVSADAWLPPCFEARRGPFRWLAPDESVGRSYLRMTLKDRPGILARVAQVLGEHGVSIASVVQKETATGRQVAVIIITHETPGRQVTRAMEEIDRLDCVGAPTARFHIEDFKNEVL